MRRAAWVAPLFLVVTPVLAAFSLLDMRDPAALEDPPPSTVAPTVAVATLPPPPLTEPLTVPVVTAERTIPQLQITTPPSPPFDPVGYVNSLAYCWQCPAPAMEAYRVVAADYGWSSDVIEARATFVQRIMAGESAFCWNSRAWSHDTYLQMPCTERKHQGNRDDVGFGQITNVLRPLTCEKVGVCSIGETIASPWASMRAYVAVLDELGRRPWCYNRNSHIRNGDCGTWPG